MAYDYRKAELDSVRDAGPADGETWFRLTVTGKERCKDLNITPWELDAITLLLSARSED